MPIILIPKRKIYAPHPAIVAPRRGSGQSVGFDCRIEVRDKFGNLKGFADVEHNDVKYAFKSQMGGAYRDTNGSLHCARKIRILEGSTVVDTQVASLVSGTGDGTVNYFTKRYVFTTTGTWSIDKAQLLDYLNNEYAEATFGAVSFGPGDTLTVEYTGTISDYQSIPTYPGQHTSYNNYEFARTFGQDNDTENLACGGGDQGDLIITYTGGSSSPKTSQCAYVSGYGGADAADAWVTFRANFTDGSDSAITLTKVEFIPSDGNASHKIAEQTTNFGGAGAGPHDLTASGGLDLEWTIYITE